MENRQERLESKIVPLTRAMVWSRRFGRLGMLIAALGLLYTMMHGFTVLSADGGLTNDAALEAVAGGFFEVVVTVFIAWWLHRIADAFSAMVDVIGELSETV